MRKQIDEDAKSKFFTYSKKYLSLAFPLVDFAEVDYKEKLSNESRWKTKEGFRDIRQENIHEHPKKPPISVIENIKQFPYYEER